LRRGEALSALAEFSEDEASKRDGGDLGYFSEARVPSEFMAEIKKLHVGETSKPFRSHLGFHIAQLTEIKPAHALNFEETRGEIMSALANERRATSVAQIAREISAFASR
jgi:foldase protein PrsA